MHANITKGGAILLMVVGVGGYLLSGQASPTALIPTVLGILMWVAEAFGSKGRGRMAGLWVPIVAIFGLAGTVTAIPVFIEALLGGGEFTLPTVGRTLTAIICAVVLVVAVMRRRSTQDSAK